MKKIGEAMEKQTLSQFTTLWGDEDQTRLYVNSGWDDADSCTLSNQEFTCASEIQAAAVAADAAALPGCNNNSVVFSF